MKKQVVLHGLNSSSVQLYPLHGKLNMLMALDLPGVIRIPTAPGSVVAPLSHDLFRLVGEHFSGKEILITPELSRIALDMNCEIRMRRLLQVPLFIPPPLTFLRHVMDSHYYARTTIRIYTFFNSQLLLLSRKKPTEVEQQDVDTFIYYLSVMKSVSPSYINTALSALSFYYHSLHINTSVSFGKGKKEKASSFSFGKTRSIPLLDHQEINAIAEASKSIKDRLILSLIYLNGLTVPEVCGIRKEDFRENHRVLRITGRRKAGLRYVLLTQTVHRLVKDHLSLNNPKTWLFEKNRGGNHLSPRDIEKIFHQACRAAHIDKEIPIASLEQSFSLNIAERDNTYVPEAHTLASLFPNYSGNPDFPGFPGLPGNPCNTADTGLPGGHHGKKAGRKTIPFPSPAKQSNDRIDWGA